MSKVGPALGHVQETLLIPLYGRACDAAAPPGPSTTGGRVNSSTAFNTTSPDSAARRCRVGATIGDLSTAGCAILP